MGLSVAAGVWLGCRTAAGQLARAVIGLVLCLYRSPVQQGCGRLLSDRAGEMAVF